MERKAKACLLAAVLYGTVTASGDEVHPIAANLQQAIADRHVAGVQSACDLLLLDLACGRSTVPTAQRMPMATACVHARKGDWENAGNVLVRSGLPPQAPTRMPLAPFVEGKRITLAR